MPQAVQWVVVSGAWEGVRECAHGWPLSVGASHPTPHRLSEPRATLNVLRADDAGAGSHRGSVRRDAQHLVSAPSRNPVGMEQTCFRGLLVHPLP